ncbi:MAG: hypothetical protein A2V93_07265 [Ignavibacteria bacterium RBG_16_34_14]|nr:MAG: hypothetical protein A2V93_07265 [Ignavibacteria bacterium RBG_16_34_14]
MNNPIQISEVQKIKDQSTFFAFLKNELNWPIEQDIEFEDATYYWNTNEFDYPIEYFKGSEIFQLRPFTDVQPWGIFFLLLGKPKPSITELRNIVRSLSPAKRKLKDYPTWKPNHLLFICTHNWQDYTIAHFEGENPSSAKLSTFEWQYGSTYLRTVCEFNLTSLRMPEGVDLFQQLDQKDWIQQWSEAFNIKKVTDKFFDEMINVFQKIQDKYVHNIKEQEKRRAFTQLLINRLLFLKFLEKKSWLFAEGSDSIEERKNYLNRQRTRNKNLNQWEQFFYHLFFRGLNRLSVAGNREIPDAMKKIIGNVPFLNGGLFEEDSEYKTAKVDNEAFDLVFDKLLNPYNFTIEENTPLDIEVALNPDLLGYAYEELIAERHGQGAYYTHPTEVGLMCRESLKTFLEEHTQIDKAAIAHLVDLRKADDLTDDEAYEVYNKLINIKIVDPAIGSGAYPVRMMQELVGIHQALAEKLSQGKLNLIIQSKLADPNSRYQLKLSIMQNNLYGSDIDYFAVEIAKLRFWLSLVVDYGVEVNEDKDLENIPALPNLDFKLRVGDSLLSIIGKEKDKGEKINLDLILKNKSPDVFFMEEANKLRGMKENYFKFEQLRKEKKIPTTLTKEDLRNGIIKQEETLASTIGIREYEKFDKSHHILWEIHFAEVFEEKEGFGFDICIANPPYVRQEKLNELFKNFESEITKDDLVEVYEDLFDDIKLKINKQSDLYVYFYFRGIQLLKEKGILCFICSNSWLDVGYGGPLQEFFLRKTRIKSIYNNSSQRSFEKAEVNTTINLFIKDSKSIKLNEVAATKKKKLLTTNLIRFVTFKDKFEQTATSEEMLKISEADKIIKNENWRVYPIKQNELYESGLDEKYHYDGDKWGGKYLRAPDIYFTVLVKGKDKLEKLRKIAEIRRGFTSGANEFFFLDEDRIKKWDIEKKYLKDVIKNPRELNKPLIEKEDLKYKVIMCSDNKSKLKGTNILKYINWGEKMNYHLRPTCASRSLWYNLGNWSYANTFWMETINDINRVYYPTFLLYESDKFYGITFNKIDEKLNYTLILNSTLLSFFRELLGFASLGEGALKLPVYEVKEILIPNIKLPNINSDILKRSMYSLFDECGFDKKKPIRLQKPNPLPDRKALDDIVFDAVGLTKAEREEVYYAVCELVQNRLNKARSV